MNDFSEDGKRRARGFFRVMLSGIFLVAATNHLLKPGHVAGRLEQAPMGWLATWMGPPEALVVMAGIALLAGGIALAVGFQTRLAALGLFLVVVPITLTVQVGRLSTMGPLFKNIGLMGGLLYFATHGARACSVDALLRREDGAADGESAARAPAE